LPNIDSEKHTKGVEAKQSLSLKEVTEVLIKHYGHHQGFFNLTVEFQIGVGNVGPDPSMPAPGVALGVTRIGLGPAPASPNKASVDASVVNPREPLIKSG